MISATKTATARRLRELLPEGWQVEFGSSAGPDGAIVSLQAPGGQAAALGVEARARVWPRDVPGLAARRDDRREAGTETNLLVVAPWLSPRTREVLAEAGLSYLDQHGSLHLDVRSPAIYVHLDGAARNPAPPPKSLRSLRGPGAGRAVRALVDFALPPRPVGVRELAAASAASASTLSRVLALLEQDDLVRLDRRRAIEAVDLAGVVRRWAQDAPSGDGDGVAYLAPRGLDDLAVRLLDAPLRYVASAAFGVQWRETPLVAPPRVATLWVDSPGAFADAMELVPADRGGNVLLRSAWDDIVFARAWDPRVPPPEARPDVAAAPQVAVDLLTGSGREPAQGEALLGWMEEPDTPWRAPWPGAASR